MKLPLSPKVNHVEPVDLNTDSTDYPKQTDVSLMQRYVAGDLKAFEALYHRHKGGLYRYFMRHIPDPALAEDLYQDIWNKVIMQSKDYRPSAKFTTWLYTLAHNKLVDHIRHLSVVNKVLVEHPEPEVAEDSDMLKDNQLGKPAEDHLADSRAASCIKQCISQLPQAQKDSFLLKEEAGLSIKDIATVLNTSFEASKSRLRYAYKNLRKCIEIKTGRAIL